MYSQNRLRYSRERTLQNVANTSEEVIFPTKNACFVEHGIVRLGKRLEPKTFKFEDSSARELEIVIVSVCLRQAAELSTLMRTNV